MSHFAGQNDRKRGTFYEKAPLFLLSSSCAITPLSSKQNFVKHAPGESERQKGERKDEGDGQKADDGGGEGEHGGGDGSECLARDHKQNGIKSKHEHREVGHALGSGTNV